MNAKKLALIVFIFLVASAGWSVLGATIAERTETAEHRLGADVARMFGPKIVQAAPSLGPRGPDATDITCRFFHENRYRGLIWFSVFRVEFSARYRFAPPAKAGAAFLMKLPADANIDALVARADGRDLPVEDGAIVGDLPKGGEVEVSYVSSGQDSWAYRPGGEGLRDFKLAAHTNFADIDYPADGLSPTTKAQASNGGRQATWQYSRMLPGAYRAIGILMPARQAAGVLSARIARFAPVSLFFFLTVMVTVQLLRNLRLHPIHYLLVAAGFFSFHILLGYLVDHVTIHAAFWLSAAVSVFLVISYLRLVLGTKRAIGIAGTAQMVYLVFFSYAFFWEGWTGLTVVIGAILTLFLIMQLTGRIDWDTRFPDLRKRRSVAALGAETPG